MLRHEKEDTGEKNPDQTFVAQRGDGRHEQVHNGIPQICLIGGFVIGYSAAGGVLQLATSTANEMFPANKGKITSIVMIASSLANYIVLNIAGMLSRIGGENGPGYMLLFNVAVTAVGILLAVILNLRFEKDTQSI